MPELAEVEAIVRGDAMREVIAAQKDKTIQAIIDSYDVRQTYQRPMVRTVQ